MTTIGPSTHFPHTPLPTPAVTPKLPVDPPAHPISGTPIVATPKPTTSPNRLNKEA